MRWLVAVAVVVGLVAGLQTAFAGSDPAMAHAWFIAQVLPGTPHEATLASWLQVAAQHGEQPTDNYRYEVEGRRDPFDSLIKTEPVITEVGPVIDPTRPRGPLERFDLSTLKLMGIVWGELGRRAIIKAPDGKGYFVTTEMYLGQNGGRVVAIEDDRLVLEERYRDTLGNVTGKTLTIPLRVKDKP
jgi:Tfp pilus assembly protein PilP